MAATPPFTAEFVAAFNGSGVTFNDFQTAIKGSALLQQLLAAFTGIITVGAPGTTGTGTSGNIISVDPSLIKKLGAIALLPYLADAIAHELGHALLTPSADQNLATASNIGGAQQIGMVQEGSAVLAEYIVAEQLKLKGAAHQNVEYSDLSGTLTKKLDGDASSNSINVASVTLSALQTPSPSMSAFIGAVTTDGGAAYSLNRPSIAAGVDGLATNPSGENGFNYNSYWADEWILNAYGYSNKLVNWSLMTNGRLSSSGDSVHGWSWTASNIPLVAGVATDKISGNTVVVNGETLSFVGTGDAAGNVVPGAVTLAVTGAATVTGGAGNDIFYGRLGVDTYVVNFRIPGFVNAGGGAVERIVADPKGNGSLTIEGGTGPGSTNIIGAAAITATGFKTWTDGTSNFQFIPGAQIAPADLVGLNMNGVVLGPAVGELKITNAGGSGSTVDIIGFNLEQAEQGVAGNPNLGFLGIRLPSTVAGNSPANAGQDPPAPPIIQGSSGSYTLSVDAPSSVAESFTVTLTGAVPSDFEAVVGDTVEALSANGSFSVPLAAGETNVAFTLVDVTADNGGSDIALGANLSLAASLPNPDTVLGGVTQIAPLTFSYNPTLWDTDAETQPSDVISGTVAGGTTTYTGDGSDDFITTTNTTNIVNAQNSGNDSIVGNSQNNLFDVSNGNNIIVGNGGTDVVVAGDGNSEIYGGAKVSLSTALATTGTATPTGLKGDLIAVQDGDNTIVGSNGNDVVVVGSGSNFVVMGPGQDVFQGGGELTSAALNWSIVGGVLQPVGFYSEGFTQAFSQPYNGNIYQNAGSPSPTLSSAASDTVYGGNGNDLIFLGNGNNYVEMGNGNSSVHGGMGNDTIIAGSGADLIIGGGGTSYFQGGSGADSLYGGDGNNTILGGSGNSTIRAALGPNNSLNFANSSLEQNYVVGGSGNDFIYGSDGQDTLIAGTGNTTIVGEAGSENIAGGSGNDFLQGGTGNSTISAVGGGNDTIAGVGSATSTSIIYGGDGVDSIEGGSGANTIYGGDGGTAAGATTVLASLTDATAITTIYGGLGVDYLQGGAGTSIIYGGDGGTAASPTSIAGSTGNDTLYGGLGTDILQGGSGTNVIFAGDGGTESAPTVVFGGAGISTLYGGVGDSSLQDTQSGNDLIVSTSANDSLFGMGTDTLIAGTGNDVLEALSGSINFDINAGFGIDSIYSDGAPQNLNFGTGIEATDFFATVQFDANNNSYLILSGDGGQVGIENALIGQLGNVNFADTGSIALPTLMSDVFGTDQTVPSSVNNLIVNVNSNESLSGGINVNDTISSWGNNDTLFGAVTGFGDLIYSDGVSARITIGTGSDSLNSVGANATILGASKLGHITISGANSFEQSSSANDVITVSGTNDTLIGGTGNESLFINNSSTIVQVSSGTDTVFASVNFTAPTNVNVLTLVGSANIAGTGNAGSDTLTGGAGQDTLIAGTGAVTMVGGSGSTTFVVNSASDVVQDSSATINNSVQSAINFTLPSNVNSLVLTGTSALSGTANNANDTLTSNSGIDTLIGGTGNDVFILNNSSDVVQDTAGTATIIYQSASNFTLPSNVNVLTLTGTAALQATGNSGNDLITGNSGADTLIAGNGIDTLISGVGIDSLVGGTGTDIFVVNNASDIVTVGGAHGVDTIESSVNYVASANVADLTLIGAGNITAAGNSMSNVITANSANDTLTAGSGVATLVGGSGNDTFVLNSASDVVQDTASSSTNTIDSSVSYSLVSNVNNLLLTGTGSLIGTANSGVDTLTGNSGVDTLTGGSASDTFVLGNAADVVQDTSAASSNVIQSSFNYTLPVDVNTLVLTGTAALRGTGNAANDLIVANAGADTLSAGNGVDTVVSGLTGADSLIGGTGNDLFIINSAADSVTVGSTHGSDTVESIVNYTLPANVANLNLAGSANLIGAAVSGNNSITGNAGSDSLIAGSGNDTLTAGSGIDTLIGGSGTDVFSINNAADVLQGISGTNDQVLSSVSYSMAANLATLTLTGSANIVGTGNGTTDFITANAGTDTLTAGSGVAHFSGGAGPDVFVVNNVADTVAEPVSKAAIDTIEASVSYTLPTGVNVLLLTGSSNLSAGGNFNTDLIIGNGGLDTLTAGGNNDTLTAGSGLATMIGGNGNDTFVVNNASDVVQDSLSGHNNVIDSSATFSLPTNVNSLLLTGTAALVATANAANDSLRGNAGADTLVAGIGADTLVAGTGLATLKGGAGSDTFIVNNSADSIQNASAGGQNILVSSATYTLPTNINVLILTGVANIGGVGNGVADTLTAGAGQDTLTAGAGVATLIGGTGNDTFVVNSTSDVVQDSSATTSNAIQSSVNYSLATNINTLILSGTGTLKGTANSANDTLISNAGVDTLVGSTGNDTFVINNSGDIVQDTSTSAINTAQVSVNYTLAANVNALVMEGTAALVGTANGGVDTLVSNTGVDTLVGGAGNDTFVVNNALDVVQDTSATTANAIQSSVNYTLPTHVNTLTLIGSAALSAAGNAASDVITANSSNDTLSAGSGTATLIGGAGNDTFIVNSTSDIVQDSATGATNTIQSSASFTLAANVNDLMLSGTAALAGTANSGNDTLVSNSGVDTLVGGTGNDLFVINNAADVILNPTSNDTIETAFSYTLPANVSNVVLFGTANISATGNALADMITAGAGVDTLTAGAGAATLIGGNGNDTFIVNNTADVVQDSSTTTSNSVLASVSYSLPPNVDTLTLTGSTSLTGMGNTDASNVLTANNGNDLLIGNALSNTINGGAGVDTINAAVGTNLIYGGNGGTSSTPTIVDGSAGLASTIYGGTGFDSLLGGSVSDLIYGGSGEDTLIGGSGSESLYAGNGGTAGIPTQVFAGSGADTLVGGSGNDILDDFVANPGFDVLIGGSGNQTLVGQGNDTLQAGNGSDLIEVDSTIPRPDQSLIVVNAGFTSVRIAQGGGSGTSANLQFGTGLSPSAETVTASWDTLFGQAGQFGIDIIGPTGSVSVDGGLNPGLINSVDFVDSGSLTLTQFVQSAVSTPATISGGSQAVIFNPSNNATINNGSTGDNVYAFGNNDTLTSGSGVGTIFGYGNNDQIFASTVGSGTLEAIGTADTINGPTAPAGMVFYVYDPSDVIVQSTADGGHDNVESAVSYTLPTNVTNLTLIGSGNLVGTGNSGNSSIKGNSGNDTLIAGTGNATIQAGAGNQLLEGGSSTKNILTSGVGNDTLVAGTGATTLSGIQGTDVFEINSASDSITSVPTTAKDTVESSVTYFAPAGITTVVLTGTANIEASSNNVSEQLIGGAGVDTLSGSGTLIGGTGATLMLPGSNTTMIGGSGADTYELIFGGDVIQNGKAADTIISALSYTLPASIGTLELLHTTSNLIGVGSSSNDTLIAGPSDTLIAGMGAATLIGGYGGDTYVINSGSDVIQGGLSTDTVDSSLSYTLPTSINALVLTGSANLSGTATSGNNNLLANSGNDTLTGGTGNDTLVAGTGIDTLIGGSGTDTFIIDSSSDVVQDSSASTSNAVQSSVSYSLAANFNSLTLTGTANLAGSASGGTDTLTSNSGVDTLIGGAGNDTFVINNASDIIQDTSTTAANVAVSAVTFTLPTDVNTLTLTGSAAIAGAANSGNDSLTGNAGANTLIGGSGADTLTAGTAADTLTGGTGNTTFVVNNVSDVVQDTSMSASNVLRSSVSYVLPTNVNSLILTGASAVTGTANNGNDTLTSNTGLDTLVGGSGNDTFIVSHAGDLVQDSSPTANNVVQSSVAFTLPTDVNTLTFTGSTALHGTGNAGNDSMTANSGADTLSAGNGTDTLVSGTTGADSLVGGTGNDLFVVNFASDIVSVGATHGNDTIQSSVTYTASANVANLTLTGTAALTGTGNAIADTIRANSGADTLTAGAGVATLVGGSGNDTFVINSASDVVQDTSTTAMNILSSSVSYTLPTNVNRLVLTGTAALLGTANSVNDTLTANTGADTLVSGAGSAIDSLVAGTGADLFVVNNTSDIVTVGGTHGVDTIQSSVSYTASTNVANLTLIGAAAIAGTGNSLAGTLTANNANDTLTAGTGIDTLVGGTGTDLFIVNSASDVVKLATSGTSDTIQSSASYTLPTNVQYLTLSGASALTGTGNNLTDLIVGNTGADTLVGGTGIAVLEGGRTAGSDQIKALSNQAALIGGAAASTLTGGAFKDFYAAGTVSDSITTGATANVVSVNKGDGATALQPTTSATNVLSLGAGIDTESLFFTKTGNNLILTDGVTGDSITFTNWYVGAADQNYTTLQVVEIASANYNALGTDGLRNKALEAFNFTALVAAYNTAGSPANWALSTAMPTTQLASSSTADYGGDLAYYFGLNGNLTGMDLSAAQSTLTNASFGTATQTIDAFSGISGGGGLHLAIAPPPQFLDGKGPVGGALGSISPKRGIQLRPSAGSPSINVAADDTGLVNEPAQSFGSSADSTVTSVFAASTLVGALQAAVNTASIEPTLRLAGADIANSVQPHLSPDDDVLRAITPRISPPVRMGVAPATSSIDAPAMNAAMGVASSTANSDALGVSSTSNIVVSQNGAAALNAGDTSLQRAITPGRLPQLLDYILPTSAPSSTASIQPTLATPRIAGTITPVTISDIDTMLGSSQMRPVVSPQVSINWSQGLLKNLVDPINIAWLTMHAALDQSSPISVGGAEASSDHTAGANDALVSGTPISRTHRLPDELDMHSQHLRQRAM